jgi:hypothetical protein
LRQTLCHPTPYCSCKLVINPYISAGAKHQLPLRVVVSTLATYGWPVGFRLVFPAPVKPGLGRREGRFQTTNCISSTLLRILAEPAPHAFNPLASVNFGGGYLVVVGVCGGV